MNRSTKSAVCAIALGCFLTGCSGDGLDRCSVSGVVDVDKVPLEQGSLLLVPIEGTAGPSAGATIENGKYEIARQRGPVPGKYSVQIKSLRKTGRQIVNEHAPPPNNLVDEVQQFIPAEYNSQSKLVAELKSGANDHVDFHLLLTQPAK